MLARLWNSIITPVAVPADRQAWLRAREFAAFSRFGPVIVLANAINVLLVAGVLWQTEMRLEGLAWSLALLLPIGLYGVKLLRNRRRPERATVSPRTIARSLRDTAVLAAIWAVFPVIFYNTVPGDFKTAVAAVTVGMLCGGAFMLSTLPRAALVWIGLITLGAYAALLQSPNIVDIFVAALLTIYAAVLIQSVRWTYSEFAHRHLGEKLANGQAELIGLLLHDFEEAASDWLWRTDAAGNICSSLARFQIHPEPADAAATVFAGLFEPGDARDDLVRRMEEGQSFSDLVVQLAGTGPVRWVSLTGKPHHDTEGRGGYQGVASDVTAAREGADRIAFLAAHDALTGLSNRSALTAQIDACIQERRWGAILLLDLDRFKVINDTMGHGAGDTVLSAVAQRLRHLVGRSGTVCRMGGDEFAVLLTDPSQTPRLVARQIVDAIELPIAIDDIEAKCSTSIGVRHLELDDMSVQDLLSQADLALYRAKARGCGHVVEFDRAMDIEAQELLQLEQDLRRAIERDEISLVYQPLVDVWTGRITGCEALSRWHHPERGAIWPDRFIAVAERCGLIVPMGDWVIRAAIAAAARIPQDVSLALNVSPVQLRNPNLVDVFADALAEHGVAAERIEVEITESVLLADTDANLGVLRELRRLGLMISLDDFGTGYSSFGYLRKFSFDKLKIDRSFIEPLSREPETVSIVGSINALAKALQMRTVAEGVETERQLDAVRFIGCDQAQGYLFDRPLTLDRLIDRIAADRAAEGATGSDPGPLKAAAAGGKA